MRQDFDSVFGVGFRCDEDASCAVGIGGEPDHAPGIARGARPEGLHGIALVVGETTHDDVRRPRGHGHEPVHDRALHTSCRV